MILHLFPLPCSKKISPFIPGWHRVALQGIRHGAAHGRHAPGRRLHGLAWFTHGIRSFTIVLLSFTHNISGFTYKNGFYMLKNLSTLRVAGAKSRGLTHLHGDATCSWHRSCRHSCQQGLWIIMAEIKSIQIMRSWVKNIGPQEFLELVGVN